MKLYSINELEAENGKIDKKDLIGLGETWIADLKLQLDNVKLNKQVRKTIECSLFVTGCMFDLITEEDLI